MPDPVMEPGVPGPIHEALLYCNIPNVAERSMEGKPGCATPHSLDTQAGSF